MKNIIQFDYRTKKSANLRDEQSQQAIFST